MKKKGFSTVELIVSFVIVSLIAIAMFGTVVDLLDRIDRYQNTTRLSIINGIIKNNIEEDFKYRKLYGINACGCNCYDFVFQDMSVKRLSVDTLKNTIKYDKYTSKIPDAYYVGGALVNKTSFDTEEGKYDRIIRISVPITEKSTERSANMNIVYQYNSRDRGNLNVFPDRLSGIGGYCCTLGYNIPILADGMTPIKWNGLSWIDTTEDDEEWYSYDEADKKWANAKTADGSMWVWIPRYVYKISSGWHTSGYSGGMPGAGTIDIQWSMGTDDTRGGLITLDAGTGAAASNNKWTSHPAFTFGDAELTGIWVAKFEASGTTNAIDIKPNVSSLRDLSVNAIFIATRNMETNSRYGWGTSGTGIDTHLMKNIEWGAVAYLAQSTYGKNAEVRRNNSSTFITGCAGLTSTYAGCENAYNTPIGLEASTTGNIYGIYDMSGGAHEYTAAYINNSYADDTGLSLYNAALKYKDVYDATNDSLEGNYNNAINKKGDAVYETSGSAAGEEAWNFDQAYMPYADNPWFLRGGSYENRADCGLFNFYSTIFANASYRGFRPVLAVIDMSPTITVLGDNPITAYIGEEYSDAGATALDDIDGNITANIQIISNVNTSAAGTYTVTYKVIDTGGNIATATRTVNVVVAPSYAGPGYKSSKGVNGPVLATGMIPVKWYENGTQKYWVTATIDDSEWYEYGTTQETRRWANAVTVNATGSGTGTDNLPRHNRTWYQSQPAGTPISISDINAMWVWIPRYAYQIATNFHTSTDGTINIKFLRDTSNIAGDNSATSDTPTYAVEPPVAGTAQTNFIIHPAFKFGDYNLTGMWVAKFEMSAPVGSACRTAPSAANCTGMEGETIISPNSLPGVPSWRYISVGNIFTVSRNMEKTDRYGWTQESGTLNTDGTFTTNTNNVDTHMMKNTEWGAVAYLSKSTYGKNAEIWINNNSTYTTGCAGNSISAASNAGCQNAYNTANGQQASTTGNIYGIYDMSGGAWEYVAAYVNNGHANLTTYGNSLYTANAKYKDIYTVTDDSDVNNYNNAIDKKGDAVYETSSSYTGSTSWYADYSYSPYTSNPWFIRGGSYSHTTNAGAFAFHYNTGGAVYSYSFRSVVLVGTGL